MNDFAQQLTESINQALPGVEVVIDKENPIYSGWVVTVHDPQKNWNAEHQISARDLNDFLPGAETLLATLVTRRFKEAYQYAS